MPDHDRGIDLPDPTREEVRRAIGVRDPHDADGLANLCATTTARVGVGRAGRGRAPGRSCSSRRTKR